jgi:hypothetical protein
MGRDCVAMECTPPWAGVNPISAPTPRQQAAATWADGRMFVWGGRGPTSDLDDGGLYQPKTDTWVSVAGGAGAPSPRVLAAAVFTGDRIVVWGGGPFGSQAAHMTGAIFKPASGNWDGPTSVVNTPSGRRKPIAVWTGTHVLIWGGEASGSPAAGGGLFDPKLNVWTSVPTRGSPGPRTGMAWAWTGTELLIFGGRPDGIGATGEGYGFDPVGNTWRTLSAAGAPSARYDAFAVWQEGTLLVFGGRDAAGTALGDGAVYDPMMDTWAALPTRGSASPRSAPASRTGSATWTGLRSLVVGGVDGDGALLMDGAQFEPLMQSWPKAVPSWPSGKEHEYGTVVWSGEELIVWSGLDGGTLVSAGERYLP